jgi:hypothetical protein
VAPTRKSGRVSPLTPKHGIRYALGLSLRGRLRLKLAPGRCRDRTIRGTIGDALQCVCYSRQLECNLVGSARSLQHNNPFSAEVNSGPEQQSNHDRCTRHKRVMTRDSDTSARESNHMI